MLKLAGAAILILCGAMAGAAMLRERRRSLVLLEELKSALGLIGGEIELCARPLPDIFRSLSRRGGTVGAFFFAVCEGCAQLPAGEVWQRCCGELELREEEKCTLAALGDVLGQYDGQRQAVEIESVRRRIGEFEQRRQNEIREKGKSWPMLGACAAAMAALLII